MNCFPFVTSLHADPFTTVAHTTLRPWSHKTASFSNLLSPEHTRKTKERTLENWKTRTNFFLVYTFKINYFPCLKVPEECMQTAWILIYVYMFKLPPEEWFSLQLKFLTHSLHIWSNKCFIYLSIYLYLTNVLVRTSFCPDALTGICN